MAGTRHDAIRDKIIGWLMEDQHKVIPVDEPDAHWSLVAVQGNALGVGIGQRRSRPARILFSINLDIEDWQTIKLNDLPVSEREDFLWDLRLRLLAMDVPFKGVEFPLRKIVLIDDIPTEGLSRVEFLKTLRKIKNGIFAVVWSLQRRFAIPPDVAGTAPDTIN